MNVDSLMKLIGALEAFGIALIVDGLNGPTGRRGVQFREESVEIGSSSNISQ
jgi:hypothetical protein